MNKHTKKYYVLLLFILILSACSNRGEDKKSSELNKSVLKTDSLDVSSMEQKDVGQEQILKEEAVEGNSTSDENISKNKSSYKVTFVELGSVNCIPCRMMQPIMKEIEKEYSDQVNVVFHDVWTEQGRPYAMKYGIRVIPTQVFLDKDGKEYFRHEGFFPKEELVKILKKQGVN